MLQKLVYGVILVAMALAPTGCAETGGIKAVDRPATAEDAPPELVEFNDAVPSKNFRLLVKTDDAAYYAGQSDDKRTSCWFYVPEEKPEFSVMSCSEAGSGILSTITNPEGVSVRFVSDTFAESGLSMDGWESVHPNVYVLKP